MEKRKTLWILISGCLIITIPYLIAWLVGGEVFIFGGVLANPTDGNTYLAKMYQGWAGSWKFVLPYTSEQGEGSYMYLFYLFLGHISRVTGLSIVLTYHLARVFSSLFLMITLVRFCAIFGTSSPDSSIHTLLLLLFGSGLGWIGLLFGLFTSDFWVAEAFPFLSMYTNAHFPFSLAVLIWIIMLIDEPAVWARIALFFGGIALALISPFGYALVGAIAFCSTIWRWGKEGIVSWSNILVLGSGGTFVVGYYFWVTATNPMIAAWSSQNITPPPDFWDMVISLSPALLLAMLGIKKLRDEKQLFGYRLVIIWLVLGLFLIYFPSNLQRRFSVGIYVPVALLAVLGLDWIAVHMSKRKTMVWGIVLGLSLPTNFIVLFTGFYGISARDPGFYLSRGEASAMEWIVQSTAQDAIVLASPEVGLLIPAHTGRRVIYGHPFETMNAEAEEAAVISFYDESWSDIRAREFIERRGVDYIFYGEREQALGEPGVLEKYSEVYHTGEVGIYQVPQGE